MSSTRLLAQAKSAYRRRDWSAAEALCLKLLGQARPSAKAWYLLALVLWSRGLQEGRDDHHLQVIDAFDEALRLSPTFAKAHFNRANVLYQLGNMEAAAASYLRALALRPSWPEAQVNLGYAYVSLKQYQRANTCFARAEKSGIKVDKAQDIDWRLGEIHLHLGQLPQARAAYQRAIKQHPRRWLRRFWVESLAEPIAPSNQYIDDYRERLMRSLDRCIEKARPIELPELAISRGEPALPLIYQGRDDKAIKMRYAELFTACIPAKKPRGSDGVPHVGVVVTRGHEGVFCKCLSGVIDRLPSKDLRLSIVCAPSARRLLQEYLHHPGLQYLAIPERLDAAADVIRAARFDLLHYWEVGTDSNNYFLPYLRLAPIQSATWGWPGTTGNPRIDYYLSADELEPNHAERHYTERLVRLPVLPTFYLRPPVPTRLKSRRDFGVSARERLYLCAQNLMKYHPDFDAMLGGILRADPKGHVLIIADPFPATTRSLLRRLRSSLRDVMDRVQLLPRMCQPDYLNVLALADVALDTPHYGGGANTVYDAVATGTPMVTLPGDFHRGRWCMAVHRRLGILDGIANSAEDYVRRCVHLANNADHRHLVSELLKAGGEELFEDARAVEFHRKFFVDAILSRRADCT